MFTEPVALIICLPLPLYIDTKQSDTAGRIPDESSTGLRHLIATDDRRIETEIDRMHVRSESFRFKSRNLLTGNPSDANDSAASATNALLHS